MMKVVSWRTEKILYLHINPPRNSLQKQTELLKDAEFVKSDELLFSENEVSWLKYFTGYKITILSS